MNGAHTLSKSLWSLQSLAKLSYMILYTLEVSLFLFACSLSSDFMKAGWKTGQIVLVAGELPSVHGIQCLDPTSTFGGRLVGRVNWVFNPCCSWRNTSFWSCFFDVFGGVPMIQCDQLSQVCIGHPPIFWVQLGTSNIPPWNPEFERCFTGLIRWK